ncbi:hypothetical protein [Catenulispora rubra]|uniref:hypothetical protein n=1 Tax=Catenulispora rubra TaxID=280293 RepID=UPI0018922E18|nr:hypothetical protein [Catenulispora rubra]
MIKKSKTKTKTVVRLAGATVLAASLAACSSSGGKNTAGVGPGFPARPNPGAGATSATAAPSPTLPGVAVRILTCGDFPVADVQTAVRQIVPTAVVTRPSDSPESTGDKNGQLECDYTVATPGTDTSSANRGEVNLLLKIGDTVQDQGDYPDSLDFDYPLQAHDFTSNKADQKAKDTGAQVDDGKPLYRDVSEKLGDDAFLEDWPHFQSDGTQTDYTIDLFVLHTPRPTGFELDLSYTMAQLDPNQPDKSLDAAIRDDTKRAQLVTGVGKVLLAKIPTKPKQ